MKGSNTMYKLKEIRKSNITGKAVLLILLTALFALSPNMQAQAFGPLLPIELMFGNEQLFFEMVIKKRFTPESKLGFFTVATFSARYEDFHDVDIALPVHMYYDVWKGFAPIAGGSMNSVVGFSPYAGLQHTYATHQILAVTVASFYLNSANDFKIFGLYEYKPPINENWSFYSRVQFMYNTSLKEESHNRSFLYLRAGVKKDAIIFGLGANLDQYGPFKTFEDNYGVFLRYELK